MRPATIPLAIRKLITARNTHLLITDLARAPTGHGGALRHDRTEHQGPDRVPWTRTGGSHGSV
jgi:hypothetical protein